MIRLGTRGSALALAQASMVAQRLRALGADTMLVPIRTTGDRLLEARLATVGGKGLFVKEIEEALLDGRIDAAVHSLKDMPAALPLALRLGAFLEREDAGDVLITADGADLADLRPGAVLGTSSPRRRAILLARRRDLVVAPLRGNVDTRLRKLASRAVDGLVLAAAGLDRLGIRVAHRRPLPLEVFVPAVGQGVVVVEVRRRDRATRRLVGLLDHPTTRACARAERAFLARLGASCITPVAGHVVAVDDGLRMRALAASEDGMTVLTACAEAPAKRPEDLGTRVAEELLERGAAVIAAMGPHEREPA